jgi:hypothetical protein
MTTLGDHRGLIPTALGIGIGGAQRSAIAVTIVGGQSLCLFLTLAARAGRVPEVRRTGAVVHQPADVVVAAASPTDIQPSRAAEGLNFTTREVAMSRTVSASLGLVLFVVAAALAQPAGGPYRVNSRPLASAAKAAGTTCSPMSPRGASTFPGAGTAAVAATDTRPRDPGIAGACHQCSNLDTLEPIGQVDAITGAGAVIDIGLGQRFSRVSRARGHVRLADPEGRVVENQSTIGGAQPDGILFDAFNERVYNVQSPDT